MPPIISKLRIAGVAIFAALLAALAPCGAAAPKSAWIDDSVAGDGTNQFSYSGTWTHVNGLHDGRSEGTSSRTSTPGGRVRFTFVGTGVRLYAVLGPAGGLGSVMVDGGAPSEVDFHAMRITPHALVYSLSNLPAKTHVLTISVEGQRDARSWGRFVNIDGAEVETAGPPIAARTPARSTVTPRRSAPKANVAPGPVPHDTVPASTTPPAGSPVSRVPWIPIGIAAGVLVLGGALYSARRSRHASPSVDQPIDATAVSVKVVPKPAQAAPSGNGPMRLRVDDTPAWVRRIDAQAGGDYDARLRLVRSLPDRAARVDPTVFAEAYSEERATEMRAAIIAAIREGNYREARPTVREALMADDESLRLLAVGALARLGDYGAVKSALSDPSLGVAVEAAYEIASAQGMARALETVDRWTQGERRTQIIELLSALS